MGISSLYCSVNKWNRFQDTSRLQNKLVWLSWGGGGGARVVYITHDLYVCYLLFHYTSASVNGMFTHSFLDLTRVVLKYILASQTQIKHLLIPLIPYINNIDEKY